MNPYILATGLIALPAGIVGLAHTRALDIGIDGDTPLALFVFLVVAGCLLAAWQHYSLPAGRRTRRPTVFMEPDRAPKVRPESISLEGSWNPLAFILGMSTGMALILFLLVIHSDQAFSFDAMLVLLQKLI